MTAIRTVLLAGVAAIALTSGVFAQDNVLRIGLLGGENEADRLRDNQCLVDLMKAELGFSDVQLFPAADYNGVIQGLLGGTLDYAELGASAYAAIYLQDPKAVEPILTTEQTDGATGYYSIMLARKDSGIATLADMKGKKLGFADPDSTSGYLVPVVALPNDIKMPVEEFFSETGFGGGHENLVLAVLDGQFDAGVTWGSGVGEFSEGYTSGNIRSMVDKGMLDMEDVVELWKSPLIPNGPIVLRSSMDQATKDKIEAFLKALPETNYECFRAAQAGDYNGYVEVDSSFYDAIIAARKAKIGG
ncbi:phosphonate ABC transporter substrate-binding protein [Devosia sp. FKR38]|uniref:phosphonate ABC transporter substrate-binding protein n=1 Tax=Devosia sp. FKR38 TaxID=2562312 RepID=UPI0010C0EF50|nr:phosphonate ABC transporter substrate-binding protein [Devosia sp. FKR38]